MVPHQWDSDRASRGKILTPTLKTSASLSLQCGILTLGIHQLIPAAPCPSSCQFRGGAFANLARLGARVLAKPGGTPEQFIDVSKGWFPYDRRRSRIADRRSQIAESSAIVCDHMETHFCDRLRSCDRDRRRSQTIAEDRTMFYLLRSSAIICDRLRSCDHMETKVLRSAIEMYPIIFLILTDDSTFLSHKARMFDYSNAHLL